MRMAQLAYTYLGALYSGSVFFFLSWHALFLLCVYVDRGREELVRTAYQHQQG